MSFAESFSPSSQHKRLCLWQDHWSGEWTMTSVTGNIEELPKSWRLHWTLKFEIRKFQTWQRWRWRRWRWRSRGSRRSRERCRFKWNLNRSDLMLNFWWAIIGIIKLYDDYDDGMSCTLICWAIQMWNSSNFTDSRNTSVNEEVPYSASYKEENIWYFSKNMDQTSLYGWKACQTMSMIISLLMSKF